MSVYNYPDWTVRDTASVWHAANIQYQVDAVRHYHAHCSLPPASIAADPTDDPDGTVDLDEMDGDSDGETD